MAVEQPHELTIASTFFTSIATSGTTFEDKNALLIVAKGIEIFNNSLREVLINILLQFYFIFRANAP